MPLVAIAAIGAASGIAGGAIASHGANKAAQTQADAATQAAQIQAGQANKALDFDKLVYGNQQLQLSPYLSIGAGASANLANLLGVLPKDAMFYPTTPQSITGAPQGTATASNPNRLQLGPDNGTGTNLDALLTRGGGGFRLPDGRVVPFNAAGPQTSTAGPSGPQGVNLETLVNPALGSTGDLMKPFEWKGPDDPAFQFRMQEGQKALERSAAAKGGLLSGGTAKAIDQYSQDLASTEYSNSFDRYRATQSDRFNRLASLAGYGPQAVAQSNTNGSNAANNIASILMQSGNNQAAGINNAGAARASGYAAGGNIWGSTLSNLGNIGTNLLLLKYLNPGGGGNPRVG